MSVCRWRAPKLRREAAPAVRANPATILAKSPCLPIPRQRPRAQVERVTRTLRVLSPAQDSDYEFRREHFCLQPPDPSHPGRKPFSSRESQRASFGLWNAQSITSQAFTNLAHHDPYHLRLAEQAFHQPVDFNTLNQNVGRIRDALNGLQLNVNVWVGTCDEPDCNDGTHNFVAVTLDDMSSVVLCPFYFMQPARTLATTFIHEAGHTANIDVNWAPGNERCCSGDDTIECNNICPISGEDLLLNVDAWMRFIHCLAMSG